MTWDTNTSAKDTQALTGDATDAAGNTGKSASVSVAVDNSGPTPCLLP